MMASIISGAAPSMERRMEERRSSRETYIFCESSVVGRWSLAMELSVASWLLLLSLRDKPAGRESSVVGPLDSARDRRWSSAGATIGEIRVRRVVRCFVGGIGGEFKMQNSKCRKRKGKRQRAKGKTAGKCEHDRSC